jgi:hypothetical protein
MEPDLTLYWNPGGHRHTVAVSRNLARGGLTVLAADIDVDVDVRSSGGRPGQPVPAVHPIVTGKTDDQRGHGGRNPDHDRGYGRHDDRHRLRLHRSDTKRPAGDETSDQSGAPTTV